MPIQDAWMYLKEPEEGGDTTDIKDMSSNPHDVVEDPGELSEKYPDVLCPEGHVDVQQLLHSERVGLLIAHHWNVVQPIKVRESLQEDLSHFETDTKNFGNKKNINL